MWVCVYVMHVTVPECVCVCVCICLCVMHVPALSAASSVEEALGFALSSPLSQGSMRRHRASAIYSREREREEGGERG